MLSWERGGCEMRRAGLWWGTELLSGSGSWVGSVEVRSGRWRGCGVEVGGASSCGGAVEWGVWRSRASVPRQW